MRLFDQAVRIAIFPLVIAASVAWFKMPIRISVEPRAHTAPVVSLLAKPPADIYDVRVIQSPALFSLPSPAGFSGPARDPNMRVSRPPEKIQPVLYLTALPEFARQPFGLTEKALEEMIDLRRSGESPALTGQPVALNERRSQPAGYRVYWQDDPVAPVRGLSMPVVNGETNRVDWRAVFFVCFDEQGFVDQLMAETPAPVDSVNQAWLRTLRAWRQEDPARSFCRRLVVQFRSAANGKDG